MQVEKRKLYRLDIAEFDDPEDDYIWLKRIEFRNGEVYYTENYVCVDKSEIDFMILEGSILTNY
jgi:hypothetical protein